MMRGWKMLIESIYNIQNAQNSTTHGHREVCHQFQLRWPECVWLTKPTSHLQPCHWKERSPTVRGAFRTAKHWFSGSASMRSSCSSWFMPHQMHHAEGNNHRQLGNFSITHRWAAHRSVFLKLLKSCRVESCRTVQLHAVAPCLHCIKVSNTITTAMVFLPFDVRNTYGRIWQDMAGYGRMQLHVWRSCWSRPFLLNKAVNLPSMSHVKLSARTSRLYN